MVDYYKEEKYDKTDKGVFNMTLKEEILSAIRAIPGLTDTELEKRFNKSHQQINQCCRGMENAGLLIRRNNPDKNGLIGNYPTGVDLPSAEIKKGKPTDVVAMTLKEEILLAIKSIPGLTDTELEKRFNKSHQLINQCCRGMENAGLLVRRNNPDKNGRIGNYPTGVELPPAEIKKRKPTDVAAIQEEDVKQVLNDWLVANGWKTTVAWGKSHGVDIEALRDEQRWLIEVKGPGSRNPMRVNYFIGILGETLQRMDDEHARYSIAFPDIDQYRRLWRRLPALAKRRTTIDMILVKNNGDIEFLE